MKYFDLLVQPGNIGYFQSCRVTLLLLHNKTTKENTLVFGRFCMQSTPATLEKGEPRDRNNLFDGYSYGILEYDISVDEARECYEALINGNWKDPAGRDLIVELPLLKLDRKYTGPDVNYRENSFLAEHQNGSHWIEFFNQGKKTVCSIYPPTMLDGLPFVQQETHQSKILAWIEKISKGYKIIFDQAQDRIGNVIFQFPVTILQSDMQKYSPDRGFPLKFRWDLQGAPVPPVFITVQSMEENSLVDQEVWTYQGENELDLLPRLTDTSLRIRVVRQSPNLVLYEWGCDCGRMTGIYGYFTSVPPQTRSFSCEDGMAKVELTRPNAAYNPLHYLEHSKAAVRKMTAAPTYRVFTSGQRGEALAYVRKLVQETRSPEILLIDPYLRCEDVMNVLYFSRSVNQPIRAIGDCRDETDEEKIASAVAMVTGDSETAIKKSQMRLDNERKNFTQVPSSAHFGLNLEMRMRIDGLGIPFHDRFLMFPGSAKDGIPPEVYSLGTSLNSFGVKYHVVAAIEHPHELIRMFNRQWEALKDPKCLVFKHR